MSEELRINRIAEVGALWCDFYHLSTPYTLFLDGQHDVVETYEMFIRKNPFNGGYTLNAGLGIMLDWLRSWKFTNKHLDLLRKYKTKTGQQKFSEDFLNMLKNTPLQVDIDALPEGELIFPNEPFVRITGPSWQCGLLESAFLNGINSSSLIATKTSRIVRSANIDGKIRPVAEFGLRRSNDFMGLIPSRSAIIGGIKKTSNMASTYVDGTDGTGGNKVYGCKENRYPFQKTDRSFCGSYHDDSFHDGIHRFSNLGEQCRPDASLVVGSFSCNSYDCCNWNCGSTYWKNERN